MYALALLVAALLCFWPANARALDVRGRLVFGIGNVERDNEVDLGFGIERGRVDDAHGRLPVVGVDVESVLNFDAPANLERFRQGPRQASLIGRDEELMEAGSRSPLVAQLHVEQEIIGGDAICCGGAPIEAAIKVQHQKGVLGGDKGFVALGSSVGRISGKPGGQSGHESGYKSDNYLEYREPVKAFSGVGLPNIRNRGNGVAVILALACAGAGSAFACALSGWRIYERRWRSGVALLVLGFAAFAAAIAVIFH